MSKYKELSVEEKDRIIEMAWEDRTPFDVIEVQFGLSEKEVIMLMKRELKLNSWKLWRERVQGRATKHMKKREFVSGVFKCNLQRQITHNKISKR